VFLHNATDSTWPDFWEDVLGCASCGCNMMHAYSAKGQKRFRYYACMYAQKRG
jgi:hypothetical protein